MNYIEHIEKFQPSREQEETDKRIILELIKQYEKKLLTRECEIAHITSTGFTMNEELNKVLMVYHNIYNSWAWTGGHADGETDLLAVAIREVQEETGLLHIKPYTEDIFSIDMLTTRGHKKNGFYVAPHLHLNITYLTIANEKENLRIKPDENSGVKWIDKTKIDSFVSEEEMFSVYHKILEKVEHMVKLKNR